MTERAPKNVRAIVVVTALAAIGASGCDGCSKSDPASAETKADASASAAASASTIPATAVSGKFGEQPFALKKASFVTSKGFGEWRVSLEGSTLSGETAAIRLPVKGALGVGKTVEFGATALTPGAKVSGINVQNGTKNTTTSNASYRVEITKWDVKPCPTDEEKTHEGGLASGRIMVKVPPENVEVSGTFTDAVVTYGQTPDWAYR